MSGRLVRVSPTGSYTSMNCVICIGGNPCSAVITVMFEAYSTSSVT